MSSDATVTPHAFWLFGLSGSGKSTLATALRASLAERGLPSLALDGDAVRAGLCAGLGFSDADRTENLRRAAEVARLGLASGLTVVASFITPLAAHRLLVASIVGTDRLSLVFLDASLETCRARDVKGLYGRAAQGGLPHMTGVSSAFERPSRADLLLDTGRSSAATSAAALSQYAMRRLGLS